MAHLRIFLLTGAFLCATVSAGFAQDAQTPAAPPAVAKTQAHKGVAKKSGHKKKADISASPAQTNSAESERAARLAEGRKKFFEQSSGFDEKDPSDRNFSLSGGDGLSPGMGFKF